MNHRSQDTSLDKPSKKTSQLKHSASAKLKEDPIDVAETSSKRTRNKNIDFSKLGQKKTLSNSSCHKCKQLIQVDEENFCKGGVSNGKRGLLASQSAKKMVEACELRFCSECLERHYRESWVLKKKNPEVWICPVCCGTCTCAQCSRRKTKESNKVLQPSPGESPVQIIIINKGNKRQDKQLGKQKSQLSENKPTVEVKKVGKKILAVEDKPLLGVREAVSDQDWSTFKAIRQKFDKVLIDHDWTAIPMLQHLKDSITSIS